MHRTPKANPDLPAHQPAMDDNNLPADDFFFGDDDIPVDLEHQLHPQNPVKVPKEKITYHPLINGKPFLFFP